VAIIRILERPQKEGLWLGGAGQGEISKINLVHVGLSPRSLRVGLSGSKYALETIIKFAPLNLGMTSPKLGKNEFRGPIAEFTFVQPPHNTSGYIPVGAS
jgi:hypothetical protein